SCRMSNNRATDTEGLFRNVGRVFSALDEKLEKPVMEHLRAVYSTLAVGVGIAAVGAMAHMYTDMLRAGFLLSIVSFGLMMALIGTPATAENEKKRLGYFSAFCFTTGISVGPLLEMALAVDPSIIATAFTGTVLIFGAFSLASLHAESTKYLFLGGSLMSATFWLLMVSVFARWLFPVFFILLAGLAISCGFVLYDTQLIVEKNRRGDHDYIWHSVELFIDFVQIFRYLVVLLSEKRDRDDRRRR
ncbi:hypothetical protein PFISCL1PPCAC_18365, partial [Pristionchus fissidentatus]